MTALTVTVTDNYMSATYARSIGRDDKLGVSLGEIIARLKDVLRAAAPNETIV
jgi:hypothetical protein